MLMSKTVKITWNGNTAHHYLEKGYTFTKWRDKFDCKVEDIMKTSVVRVEVKCDYCEDGVSWKPYRDFLKSRVIVDKDCCKNRPCMVKKSEDVNMIKYGVKNINQTEKRKEEARKMFQTPKEEVIKTAKSKGVTILNIEEYQNDRTRLRVICEKHSFAGEQETNYSNIKKNKHCCHYVRSDEGMGRKRIDGSLVYEEFKEVGLIPLFSPEDYKGNEVPLPYLCPKHKSAGTQYRTRGNLFYAKGCKECFIERVSLANRNDMEKVEKYFSDKDIIPIDLEKYKSRETLLEFTCPHHPNKIQEINIGRLRNTKVPCLYCRESKSIASLNKRLRSSIGFWIEQSQKECNYKCVLTGSKDYEVHHLYSFNSIILESLAELNIETQEKYCVEDISRIRDMVKEKHQELLGVCIHPALHIEFHRVYKKENNTPEQFEEFKERYKNGEFNEVLNERSPNMRE